MGILGFDWMTTDMASTTFYGLSNTESYSSVYSETYYHHIVLAKSNTNPTSVWTTSWSFLSSYSSKSLSIKNGIPITAGCAVDSRGVVTFVVAHYIFTRTDQYTKYITAVQYNPVGATDPTMSQGVGSWSVLSLNPTSGESTFEKIWLYYSTTVTGAETLNLAYLTRFTVGSEPSIVIGTFEGATSTFNPTGRWDMAGVIILCVSSSLPSSPFPLKEGDKKNSLANYFVWTHLLYEMVCIFFSQTLSNGSTLPRPPSLSLPLFSNTRQRPHMDSHWRFSSVGARCITTRFSIPLPCWACTLYKTSVLTCPPCYNRTTQLRV